MAVAGTLTAGLGIPSKFRPLSSKIYSQRQQTRASPPAVPIYISTKPTDVDPLHLKRLCTLCNHSFHRFPNVGPNGRVDPVDVEKLRIALAHSSVVVSVFSKPEFTANSSPGCGKVASLVGVDGDWFRRRKPLTPETGQLVGFGRAVSDCGLTASIYDVMVNPSLQGRGIGQMIVQRILRLLTGRGIYDISALCSDDERLFFKACGFGDDTLKSTTMMYGKTVSSSTNENQMVVSAGRKILVVPLPREPCRS